MRLRAKDREKEKTDRDRKVAERHTHIGKVDKRERKMNLKREIETQR